MSGNHHHGLGFVDPLAALDSPVHRIPAPLKLACALAIVLAIVLTPVTRLTLLTVFPSIALLLIATCGAGFIPPLFIVRRLLMLEPVVLAAGALAFFQPHGPSVFATLALRSSLCIATMVLLSCVTPFASLLIAMRRLGMPALMTTTIGLTFRYLFLLSEEHARLQRARHARTYRRTHMARWTTAAALVGQLFVRTAARAERVHAAMLARSWK